MLPRVIMHNAVSLDGRIDGFRRRISAHITGWPPGSGRTPA